MANGKPVERPLSPHLTIYRPQLTSITSILTRITGNALIISALLVVWWLLAAAVGPAYYEIANAVLTSWFGDIVMSLSVLGVWYHSLQVCVTSILMRVTVLISRLQKSSDGLV